MTRELPQLECPDCGETMACQIWEKYYLCTSEGKYFDRLGNRFNLDRVNKQDRKARFIPASKLTHGSRA